MRTRYLHFLQRFAKRAFLDLLLRHPSTTPLQVCELTGLPRRIVSAAALDLVHSGWLCATDSRAVTDRAIEVFQLVSTAAYSLGVDLGGTKVAAALADFSGTLVTEAAEPTDPRGGPYVVEQIVQLAKKLSKRAGLPAGKLQSAVIGIPGAIEPKTGKISLAPNIKGLADLPIWEALRGSLCPHVALENDVNLAMIGELQAGCAQGSRSGAFLALGTGVGLGLVIDGKPLRGVTGAAGEIAYLPIGRSATSLAALSTGAFELEVGSTAILQRYRLDGEASINTVREVFDRLHQGDGVAEAVLTSTAHTVALGIAGLQAILDLDLIVLGGSIGSRHELVERVQQAMAITFPRPVPLRASTLGTRAGVIGATLQAVARLHDYCFGEPVLLSTEHLLHENHGPIDHPLEVIQ